MKIHLLSFVGWTEFFPIFYERRSLIKLWTQTRLGNFCLVSIFFCVHKTMQCVINTVLSFDWTYSMVSVLGQKIFSTNFPLEFRFEMHFFSAVILSKRLEIKLHSKLAPRWCSWPSRDILQFGFEPCSYRIHNLVTRLASDIGKSRSHFPQRE